MIALGSVKVPASLKFLFILFLETPSADEAEVYRNIQACLEMRQSYVFRESVAPWVKEVISDPSTPKPNPNPFEFTAEGKSDVSTTIYFNARVLWYMCATDFIFFGTNFTRSTTHNFSVN